jgi:hypothetical protein
LFSLCLLGCGGSTERVFGYGDPDADAIAGSISVLSDFADRPERFEPLFAERSVPDQAARQKFAEYSFATVDKPVIAGDTATARVEVRDLSEKSLGVQQWTAIKKDGKWLLKETPLP